MTVDQPEHDHGGGVGAVPPLLPLPQRFRLDSELTLVRDWVP